MAAHLARHNSTIHAPKKRKVAKAKVAKKAKRSTVRRKVVRTVAASRAKIGPIRAFSTGVSGFEGIIDGMKAHQSELLAQRTSLDAQIDAFARAMEAVLSVETFCTFLREFSPLSPVIAQNSSSNLLGLRLVRFARVAQEATAVMIDA